MNNKFLTLAAVSIISLSGYAQKDELKTLKKLAEKEAPTAKDVTEYKSVLTKADPLVASASETDKLYINYYKARTPIIELSSVLSKPENQNKPQLAMQFVSVEKVELMANAYTDLLEYEKKTGKSVYTSEILKDVALITPTLLNFAVGLGDQKKFAEGGQVLYNVYRMDKSKPDNLYFAASYAVNAQDYDRAMKYYEELKTIKYSGEGISYLATNVITGKEEPFNNKADRDKMITFKTHINPRQENIPSKRGEIYKNYALILLQKDKIDEAKAAFAEAKAENPNDVSLLVNESDLYLRIKDYDTYKKLVADILVKNPNDKNLLYNLGVVTLEANQLADAEKYFQKTLELDPEFTNAYLNMSAIKLRPDAQLVAEMNKLGTSNKDNLRYDVLKKEREKIFKSALPFLEKAYKLDPENDAVIDNLLSVYNFLEMTDQYKALKAKKK